MTVNRDNGAVRIASFYSVVAWTAVRPLRVTALRDIHDARGPENLESAP